MARLSSPVRLNLCITANCIVTVDGGPTTPMLKRHNPLTQHRFRLFPVRSPLLRESILLSLPPGTKMFQFPGFTPANYEFTCR